MGTIAAQESTKLAGEVSLALLIDVLDSLNVSFETAEERMTCQGPIYLATRFGVPFGYLFQSYNLGPYSPSLADDCEELMLRHDEARRVASSRTLKAGVNGAIERVRAVMVPSETVPVETDVWLELVCASVILCEEMHGARFPCELDDNERLTLETELIRRRPTLTQVAEYLPDVRRALCA